jgi:hypothetical protein
VRLEVWTEVLRPSVWLPVSSHRFGRLTYSSTLSIPASRGEPRNARVVGASYRPSGPRPRATLRQASTCPIISTENLPTTRLIRCSLTVLRFAKNNVAAPDVHGL